MRLNVKAAEPAWKAAACITTCFLIFRMLEWGIRASMGTLHFSLEEASASLAGIFFLTFVCAYMSYERAVNGKAAAWFIIGCRNLAQLEEKLNALGAEGYLCEKAAPDWFLFKMKASGQVHYYKTAYVPSGHDTAFQKYIQENQADGWEYVADPDSARNVTAVFISSQKHSDLEPGRHDPARLNRRLTGTVLVNTAVTAFAAAVAVFVLPGNIFAIWMTALFALILLIQVIAKLKLNVIN